jgi:hypothetical protein
MHPSESPPKEPRTDIHSQSGDDVGSRDIFPITIKVLFLVFTFCEEFQPTEVFERKILTIETK